MIWELRHEHKIGLLIEIADIPRSTYYYYSKQFEHPKPDRYAEIKTEIRRIYEESKGRYGYRRITKELKKKFVINHKTVQKLMRKMGIFAVSVCISTTHTRVMSAESHRIFWNGISKQISQIRSG